MPRLNINFYLGPNAKSNLFYAPNGKEKPSQSNKSPLTLANDHVQLLKTTRVYSLRQTRGCYLVTSEHARNVPFSRLLAMDGQGKEAESPSADYMTISHRPKLWSYGHCFFFFFLVSAFSKGFQNCPLQSLSQLVNEPHMILEKNKKSRQTIYTPQGPENICKSITEDCLTPL